MVTISNVHFGGTLNQHIYHDSSVKSRQELVHGIYKPNVVQKNKHTLYCKVNSLHHQSIKQLGEGLEIIAIADDDHVEAIMHNQLPIYAVQYHPEEIYDNFSKILIEELLNPEQNEQQN